METIWSRNRNARKFNLCLSRKFLGPKGVLVQCLSYHFLAGLLTTKEPETYSCPEPFSLSEFDPKGILSERVYSKKELLDYLEYFRKKVFFLIQDLNEETSKERFITKKKDYNRIEMILYSMRHAQHHVGQLNLLLRQNVDLAGQSISESSKHY